ncbi:MAG: radical SAM-associated putative lipoprotein [Paludibacteraceae bacterium]|nr:radical SAM-associated putative lipoprotein [Paludibacteraceae bacterium]
MKAKIITKVNALITLLLGVLGFNSCDMSKKYGPPEVISLYGTPYTIIDVKGRVADETNKPLKNIRVELKDIRNKDYPMDEKYTDENGEYTLNRTQDFSTDSIDIVATDTAGVYESDSVRLTVDYDMSDANNHGGFYEGTGHVYQDFQLKKK